MRVFFLFWARFDFYFGRAFANFFLCVVRELFWVRTHSLYGLESNLVPWVVRNSLAHIFHIFFSLQPQFEPWFEPGFEPGGFEPPYNAHFGLLWAVIWPHRTFTSTNHYDLGCTNAKPGHPIVVPGSPARGGAP